jgi:hypothetical protein
MGRNKVRSYTKEVKLRIDVNMENDLRILYGLDKKAIGDMSFNQWLVLQFHGIIEKQHVVLNIVKGSLVSMHSSTVEENKG